MRDVPPVRKARGERGRLFSEDVLLTDADPGERQLADGVGDVPVLDLTPRVRRHVTRTDGRGIHDGTERSDGSAERPALIPKEGEVDPQADRPDRGERETAARIGDQDQEHDRDEDRSERDEARPPLREHLRSEDERQQREERVGEPAADAKQHQDHGERDGEIEEDDVLVGGDGLVGDRRGHGEGPTQSLLVVEKPLDGLHAHRRDEDPCEDPELRAIADQVRREEVQEEEIRRSA